ncbi:MAG TPA: hypothetical protein VLA46_12955 [Saprospiraceae bacterium]|nr:hypothetical protein [Saprospiraceae bacterium]
MAHPIFLVLVTLLSFSLSSSGQESDHSTTKSFSSNIYFSRSGFTINITYTDSLVYVERMENSSLNELSPLNILFSDTEYISLDTDGYIHLLDTNHIVWFIPFEFGEPPHRVENGKKWLKYVCNCKGIPGMPLGGVCETINTGDSIWCSYVSGMSCFANEKGCRGTTSTFNRDEELFYKFYSGGVIVQGELLKVKDPDYFKPVPPIEFIEDENGNIYLRSDYEKMKGIKKD